MSSRYRYKRKSMKMFHPAIPLDREPTFNQKTGQVLQRTPIKNVEHSGRVLKKKDFQEAYELANAAGLIPSQLKTAITSVSTTLTANENNEYLLNYDNLKGDIAEAIGISVRKIHEFDLQAITVRVPQGNFPKISYRWVVGTGAFPVTSGTNSLGGTAQYAVKLGTPIIYQPYDPNYINIVCPQVKNSSSLTTVVSVQWDQTFSQNSGSTHHEVYDLWHDGVRNIPWVWYDVRVPDPIDVYTELSVDMTGNTNNGQLMLECMVVYE